MPLGEKITIRPEDIPYWNLAELSKLSKEELDAEHRKRIKKAPGFRPELPPEVWTLHETNYDDEVELLYGKKWGAQGIGKLTEVLLCPPTENEVREIFKDDPIAYNCPGSVADWVGQPNLEKWKNQYADLVKTYSENGVLVHQFEIPEMVMGPYGYMRIFWSAADVGIVFKGGIIPTNRPALGPLQRGRDVIYNIAVHRLGIPILYQVRGKGIAELGGCLWLDDAHFLAEDGPIMNREAIDQLKPVLKHCSAEMIIMRTVGYLNNVQWPAGGTNHPDMQVAIPDMGVAVVYPPFFSFPFIRFLKKLRFDVIEIKPENYRHCTINMVNLAPGKVICPDGDRDTIREMEKRGIDVIALPYTESVNITGGIHCSTCQLIREPGPLVQELVGKSIDDITPGLS